MSLLFQESCILGINLIGSIFLTNNSYLIGLYIFLLILLLFFYRHTECEIRVDDTTLLSPCEGTVLKITRRYGYYYIAIFLSPFNRHTQIYPMNGTVISRRYDNTGEFNVVMYLGKSANNEKKTHYMLTNNGVVMSFTQIAGFLPRVISSDNRVGHRVSAGEYLGIIKFGSRVDVLIPDTDIHGNELKLSVLEGDEVCIGDIIGKYLSR
jgi:phosphatidylserine decarboxylase